MIHTPWNRLMFTLPDIYTSYFTSLQIKKSFCFDIKLLNDCSGILNQQAQIHALTTDSIYQNSSNNSYPSKRSICFSNWLLLSAPLPLIERVPQSVVSCTVITYILISWKVHKYIKTRYQGSNMKVAGLSEKISDFFKQKWFIYGYKLCFKKKKLFVMFLSLFLCLN